MGGSDDPSNLVELSIEDHAQAHLDLYEKYGYEQDLVAHRMLLGQIDRAEAIKVLQKAPKSERWKQTMSKRMTGEDNPQYGKPTSDKQKEAVGKSAKERFTGVPKNYKVINPVMYGKDNPRSRVVIADGVQYETLRSACDAHGLKNHNAGAYRIKSDKWDWRYED